MLRNVAKIHATRVTRASFSTLQASSVKVDNPYTGKVYTEVAVDSKAEAHQKVDAAAAAQRDWMHVPLAERQALCSKWIDVLAGQTESIAADISGNSVILKHSPRTPLCGEHYQKTFELAGFPTDVLQASFVDHNTAAEIINRQEVGFVSFTGSVRGGSEVNKTASSRFIDVTLELGGNDAAYVAADADPIAAAEGLVDGVCYNAGQSCCGVERIYVHEDKYDAFLEKAKELFDAYTLGDPFDPKTSLGPMALPTAPASLDAHVKDAIAKGAQLLTGSGIVTDSAGNGRFYSPTLLANCNGSMEIMKEESFGPIVGVEKVKSDEEAIGKINCSQYGLTAAVFTSSRERGMRVGSQLSAGTVFMNRCDALDPYLPWTGLRDSGKGASLSKYGFRALTKLKSWNFRV
ncbi:hypothetical protein ATCC90586_001205 [Pythium insidiosum]|nr:hypothetical protein ATCC90586_001205 [Pythium insidiosum]